MLRFFLCAIFFCVELLVDHVGHVSILLISESNVDARRVVGVRAL